MHKWPRNDPDVHPLSLHQQITFLANAFTVFSSGHRNNRQRLEELEREHFSFSQTSTRVSIFILVFYETNSQQGASELSS